MPKDDVVQSITCPHCGKEIPSTDVLKKQIEEKSRAVCHTQLKKKDVDCRLD